MRNTGTSESSETSEPLEHPDDRSEAVAGTGTPEEAHIGVDTDHPIEDASRGSDADAPEGGEASDETARSGTDQRRGLRGRLQRAMAAARARTTSRRRLFLVSTASLAVLVLVATTALFLVAVRPAQQTEQARLEGLAAARTAVEQVLSYQPASQDADLERARGLVTGDFGRQFETVLDSVVRPALDGGIGTRTVVTRAGVVSADAERVTALLYLTQEASRAGEPPRTNLGRAEVTVQQVDGRWLVSDLRNF